VKNLQVKNIGLLYSGKWKMGKRYNFFEPHLNNAVIEEVSKAFLNKNIGFTETVFQFEDALSELGLTSPVCVSSASAGLVVSLKALGIGVGDEVIIPRQTFIATGLAVLEVGAQPVFCDIDITTGSLDPISAERLISSKTRALIFVHWGGNGHNSNTFIELSQKYNIGLIEDAAHAFGGNVNTKEKIGQIKFENHFVVFSFQAIKFFTTGDGGCICSHSKYYKDLKSLSWFGIDKTRSKGRRKFNEEKGLNISLNGYKFNMNAIQASIGLANLKNIDQRIRMRRDRAEKYYQAIKKSKKIKSLIKNKEQIKLGIFWFFPLLCENRIEVIKLLNYNDVPNSTVDYRIDVNPIFKRFKKDSSIQQDIFDSQFLALSLGDHIPDIEFNRFCEVLNSY
jgi:perosamine synthetase